jgi:hypothetical protein
MNTTRSISFADAFDLFLERSEELKGISDTDEKVKIFTDRFVGIGNNHVEMLLNDGSKIAKNNGQYFHYLY